MLAVSYAGTAAADEEFACSSPESPGCSAQQYAPDPAGSECRTQGAWFVDAEDWCLNNGYALVCGFQVQAAGCVAPRYGRVYWHCCN